MRIENAYPVSSGEYNSRIQQSRSPRSGETAEGTEESKVRGSSRSGAAKQPGELTEEEKKELETLKETDRKVRAHERAHLAAAAGISISGAQFEYQRGPDGVMYAVGGEVNIDTSPVRGDPQATLEKAQKIERAAMAPVDPSPQDYKVAAQARQMAAEARIEMMKQTQSEGSAAADASSSALGQPFGQEKQQQGQILDITA